MSTAVVQAKRKSFQPTYRVLPYPPERQEKKVYRPQAKMFRATTRGGLFATVNRG